MANGFKNPKDWFSFSDYNKELPSSWDTEEVKKWKESALSIQKNYYLYFGGSQWDAFNMPGSIKLLRSKICYALYGPPTEPENNIEDLRDIEDLYKPEQQKRGEEIIEKILSFLPSCAKIVKVGFVFVCCKREDEEFTIPVFRVFRYIATKGVEVSGYVDTNCRTYESWEDWKSNNNLPMMKYCYPKSGYYTCSDGEYKFDENSEPVVEYGNTPSCNVASRVGRQTDLASSIIMIGSGIVGGVALFTPIAPAVVLGSVIVGGTSATYGAGRTISRLVDKGTHGEDLRDLESVVLWITLAATPLNFATSAMNGFLQGTAAQGRILTSSIRTFATVLNFTTLGVDSVMLGFGIFNLVEKGKANQLEPLDIVQFSMSVFFFTNTLLQPKVASKIIAKAQNEHINQYLNSMTDEQAQVALQKFVRDNSGSKTITDTSKIIRALNRIDDPNAFFKNVGSAEKIIIGGRKGKTVLVTDANGQTNRINPNRAVLTSDGKVPVNFKATQKVLTDCFDKDLKDVELNGKKIFFEMTDKQKAALKLAFKGLSAYKDNYETVKAIVLTAFQIAERLGCISPEQLASFIEIVAAEIHKGIDGYDKLARLLDLQGTGIDKFIETIKRDLRKIEEIRRQKDLKFADEYKALYHYRKHGDDFTTKGVNTIEFYLDFVPDKLIKDANLTEIKTFSDGTVRKFYRTQNDSFAVVTETPDQRIISSIYRNPGSYKDFTERLNDCRATVENPSARIIEMGNQLALNENYLATHIYLGVQTRKPLLLEKCTDVNDSDLQEIVRQLYALGSETDENKNQ